MTNLGRARVGGIFRAIDLGAIVVSAIVFSVIVFSLVYLRTNFYVNAPLREYVVQHIPSELSGEERQVEEARLVGEFVNQPSQVVVTLIAFSFCFLVAGYVAGTMSENHINVVIVTLVSALLLARGNVLTETFWITSISGLIFGTLGSKWAIVRRQRENVA